MENLSSMLEQNIDILCVAETKLDSSYPTNQFHLQGYKTPYRFDVSSSSGGILVYIKESLPSKTLNEFSMDNDIQAIPLEINFKKCKWLILPIYRPGRTSGEHTIDNISRLLDFYANKFDNLLILGDFNMTEDDGVMLPLLDRHKLYSMVKQPT